jgi:hypothetical protein
MHTHLAIDQPYMVICHLCQLSCNIFGFVNETYMKEMEEYR